jgi:CRISPR-associated endoribonuclease Cas6
MTALSSLASLDLDLNLTARPDIVGAVRVELRPEQNAAFRAGGARPLHAALHRLLETVDPDLSRAVHDEDVKRFAVSPLYRADPASPSARIPAGDRVGAGERVWVRITTLERDVLSAFLAALAHAWMDRRPIDLDWHPFTIEAIEPLAWRDADAPSVTSYRDLVAGTPPAAEVALRFVSPVVIRNRGTFLVPDQPWSVFGGYLRRWRAFSDVPLPGIDEEAVRAGVTTVPGHSLVSAPINLGFGRQVGYTGEVRFRVADDDRLRHGIAVLAEYATWCATGARTTFGLGQTRRHLIEPEP